jgi:hypothetical protein
MKTAALLVVLLLISAAVVEAQPIRDFIDRILGREKITRIEDILKEPENFDGKNVTVEGIFTERSYFSWVRGDLWGVDENGNVLTIQVNQSESMNGRDFYKHMDQLYDKKVRVKGFIDVLEDGKAQRPLLVADVSAIEVI